ncbi:hypothetical protein ATZ36_10285 [Candidatus Endomicrobiellum trichonymphae]|uniref:Uncharacterized protein n=1 Tax=Endomicrobium trichonymphae TaxID=1408204 RepID=A0A1E5IH07_ENDTX|nr:hypothetical protein ATZ36_10285 [Candidatus Endomicrobium trichonymphae]
MKMDNGSLNQENSVLKANERIFKKAEAASQRVMELIVVAEKIIKETEQVALDAYDSVGDGQTEIDRLRFLFVKALCSQ